MMKSSYGLDVAPSQDASDHQDFVTFSVGDPYKPSYTTVTVRGPYPTYEILKKILVEWNTLSFFPTLSCSSNLAGGFNPFEKYLSNWIISPRIRVKMQKHV